MEQNINEQLISLLLFFAGGLELGLLYDMLRPARWENSRAGLWMDALFCALGGFLFFCLGMRGEAGRLGTWELAASLLGFCLYINLLSSFMLPIFVELMEILKKFMSTCKNLVRNLVKTTKNIFQKLIQCFIINE